MSSVLLTLQRRRLGDIALVRCPPAAADDVFQERVDGIERSSWRSTGQDKLVPDRLDDDAVVPQLLQVDVRQ